MVLEVIWGGIVQMWGIAAVAKRCQTYKVWTQVSFDFPFYFILFYFLFWELELGFWYDITITAVTSHMT